MRKRRDKLYEEWSKSDDTVYSSWLERRVIALENKVKKFTSINSESKSAAQIFSEMDKCISNLKNIVSKYCSLHSVRG